VASLTARVFAPHTLAGDAPATEAFFSSQMAKQGYRRVPGTELTTDIHSTDIMAMDKEEPDQVIRTLIISGEVERS
jgi:hypothetical protein